MPQTNAVRILAESYPFYKRHQLNHFERNKLIFLHLQFKRKYIFFHNFSKSIV